MSYEEHNDTIVALSTPQGVGALAIVRLSGNRAIEIVNSVFSGKDLSKVDSHTLHFGTIRKENEVIDEVVVSVFIGPNSYTREDIVEISCHGSMHIARKVIMLLVEKGARLAKELNRKSIRKASHKQN